MQLVVEAAGVTNRIAVVVPPPEAGVGGEAVGALQPCPATGRLLGEWKWKGKEPGISKPHLLYTN